MQYTTGQFAKDTNMTDKIKTPPEDRIYDDDDGFFLRAASVCVKDQNESEVNVVIMIIKCNVLILPPISCNRQQRNVAA